MSAVFSCARELTRAGDSSRCALATRALVSSCVCRRAGSARSCRCRRSSCRVASTYPSQSSSLPPSTSRKPCTRLGTSCGVEHSGRPTRLRVRIKENTDNMDSIPSWYIVRVHARALVFKKHSGLQPCGTRLHRTGACEQESCGWAGLRPLSLLPGWQAAFFSSFFKCPYRGDSVTRDWSVALRVRAANNDTRICGPLRAALRTRRRRSWRRRDATASRRGGRRRAARSTAREACPGT